MLRAIVVVALLAVLGTAEASSWRCPTIKKGRHSPVSLFMKGLSSKSELAYWINFDKYTPYNIQKDCQGDWNKLWGKSRCGYFNSHHKDSDRFVWRAHAKQAGKIELAAYAYDNGKKPYQNQGTLLKALKTAITPGVRYGSKIIFQKSQTIYKLYNSNGNLLETVTIAHSNKCKRYNRGYKVGLYFGGNCKSPSDITVCYRASEKRGSYAIKAEAPSTGNTDESSMNSSDIAVFASVGVVACALALVGGIAYFKRRPGSASSSDPQLLGNEVTGDMNTPQPAGQEMVEVPPTTA